MYPYSISQPSSFRHAVLPNTASQQVDYYFPSLGSFTTNVNIAGAPGHVVNDEVTYLRSVNGLNIHRSGWLVIMDKRRALMRADFRGLAGRYTIEQVTFAARGYVWRLTASYDFKYRKLRGTMLRMLRSFRLDR